MAEKVLIVDDDPNVLRAYERRLRKKFRLETALCSEEGITAVNFLGPFAVVVSDMMMPRENGADFLAKILLESPDSTRIMLTGNSDQGTAADAINKGRVFRFLNKPCDADELEKAIAEGIELHKQAVAEREMLSGTLLGAVDMLSRVLALTNPAAFGSSIRLKSLVSAIAKELNWDDAWRHETAALLSQLGCVAVPDDVVRKAAEGHELSTTEANSFAAHPSVGGELISAIPKLNGIAEVVASQNASSFTGDQQLGADGPRSSVQFGVQLLRLCRDYDTLTQVDGHVPAQAIQLLQADADAYNADCLDALEQVVAARDAHVLLDVSIAQLAVGMQLVQDVETEDGSLLVAKGAEVTTSLQIRLVNYSLMHEIREPLQVLASAELADSLGIEPAAQHA